MLVSRRNVLFGEAHWQVASSLGAVGQACQLKRVLAD